MTQSFVSNTNDQLLVVYLSSLLRSVIALHALVDNKATNGRAELEENKEKGNPKTDKADVAKSGKDEAGKEPNAESSKDTEKPK